MQWKTTIANRLYVVVNAIERLILGMTSSQLKRQSVAIVALCRLAMWQRSALSNASARTSMEHRQVICPKCRSRLRREAQHLNRCVSLLWYDGRHWYEDGDWCPLDLPARESLERTPVDGAIRPEGRHERRQRTAQLDTPLTHRSSSLRFARTSSRTSSNP